MSSPLFPYRSLCGLQQYTVRSLVVGHVCNCRGSLLPCLVQPSCAASGLQQYNIRNLVVEQVRGDPRGLSDMRRAIDVRRYKAAIVVCGECEHVCIIDVRWLCLHAPKVRACRVSDVRHYKAAIVVCDEPRGAECGCTACLLRECAASPMRGSAAQATEVGVVYGGQCAAASPMSRAGMHVANCQLCAGVASPLQAPTGSMRAWTNHCSESNLVVFICRLVLDQRERAGQ